MAFLKGISAMLTGLLAGWDAVFLLPVNREFRTLPDAGYARAHRSVVRIAGPTAPFLAGPLLLMDALLLLKTRRVAHRTFAWTALSFLCVLLNASITLAVNVPINRKFLRAPGESPPENWENLRDTWATAHNIRTASQILGFAFLLAGTIEPHPNCPETRTAGRSLEGK